MCQYRDFLQLSVKIISHEPKNPLNKSIRYVDGTEKGAAISTLSQI